MDALTMTDKLSDFISYVSRVLPDDVTARLNEVAAGETTEMAKMIYAAMDKNQQLAVERSCPCCQDTGMLQMYAHVGTDYPLRDELPEIFTQAVREATKKAPLRQNAVQTFEEVNTGDNTGLMAPWVDWELVPRQDGLVLDVYMAGGGCSLPARAAVLVPGKGYEGVCEFVMDTVCALGLNACPPLVIGVGIGTSMDTAAVLSKKALLRPMGVRNADDKAAKMETELLRSLNAIGIGPQGLVGNTWVMDLHIANSARHTATMGVGVSFGCWSLRRGRIEFRADGSVVSLSHSGVEL